MNVKDFIPRIGSVAAVLFGLLLFILFFAPWVELGSWLGAGDASGLRLSVGNLARERGTDRADMKELNESVGARPWYLLCLLLSLAILAVSALSTLGKMPQANAGMVLIGLAVVGLIMMILAATVDYGDEIEEGIMEKFEEGGEDMSRMPTARSEGARAFGMTDAGAFARGAMRDMGRKAARSSYTETTGVLWFSLMLYILVGRCGAANLLMPKLLPLLAGKPQPAAPVQPTGEQPPPPPAGGPPA